MAAKVRAWLPRLRGLWESIKIQGLRHQNGNHSPGVLIKPIGYNHQQLVALRPAFRAPVFNIFTAEKSRLQLLQKLFPFKPLTSLPVPVRAVNHHCRFYYQRSSLIVNPCLVRNFARGNRAALGFGRNFSSFPQASAKGGGVLAQLGVKPFTTAINMNGVSWRKTNEIEEKVNLSETKVQRRKPKTGKKKTVSQSLLSVAPGTKANKVDNDSSSTSLQKNTASPAHQGIPSLQKSIVNQFPAHQGNDDDVYMSGGKLITSRVKQLDPSIIQSIHEVATTEQNHSMAIISILRILLQHKAFDVQVLDFEIRIFFGMGVEDVTRLLNCLGIDQKSLNFTLKSETTNPSTKLAVVVIFEPTNSQLSTLIKVGDHESESTKSAPINLNEYIVDHKLSHLSTIIEASDHEPEPTPPLPRPLTLPFALFPKKNNGTDSRPCSASHSSPIHGEGDIDDFLSQVDSRPSLNVKPRDGQSEIRYKKW